MPRLAYLLIAAVLAVGLGVPLAQSQTEPAAPPAAQTAPAAKSKKGMTAEEKAAAKEDRKAARKKERQEKAAAKKAKAQECRAKGKQDALKGKDLRSFVKSCVAGRAGFAEGVTRPLTHAPRVAAVVGSALVSPKCWPQSIRMHSPVIVVAPSTRNSAATATSYGQMPRLSGY